MKHVMTLECRFLAAIARLTARALDFVLAACLTCFVHTASVETGSVGRKLAVCQVPVERIPAYTYQQ